MFDDLKALTTAAPFRPFLIHAADGRAVGVPHADHLFLFPTKEMVLVVRDSGGWELIDVSHVVRISSDADEARAAA